MMNVNNDATNSFTKDNRRSTNAEGLPGKCCNSADGLVTAGSVGGLAGCVQCRGVLATSLVMLIVVSLSITIVSLDQENDHLRAQLSSLQDQVKQEDEFRNDWSVAGTVVVPQQTELAWELEQHNMTDAVCVVGLVNYNCSTASTWISGPATALLRPRPRDSRSLKVTEVAFAMGEYQQAYRPWQASVRYQGKYANWFTFLGWRRDADYEFDIGGGAMGAGCMHMSGVRGRHPVNPSFYWSEKTQHNGTPRIQGSTLDTSVKSSGGTGCTCQGQGPGIVCWTSSSGGGCKVTWSRNAGYCGESLSNAHFSCLFLYQWCGGDANCIRRNEHLCD